MDAARAHAALAVPLHEQDVGVAGDARERPSGPARAVDGAQQVGPAAKARCPPCPRRRRMTSYQGTSRRPKCLQPVAPPPRRRSRSTVVGRTRRRPLLVAWAQRQRAPARRAVVRVARGGPSRAAPPGPGASAHRRAGARRRSSAQALRPRIERPSRSRRTCTRRTPRRVIDSSAPSSSSARSARFVMRVSMPSARANSSRGRVALAHRGLEGRAVAVLHEAGRRVDDPRQASNGSVLASTASPTCRPAACRAQSKPSARRGKRAL